MAKTALINREEKRRATVKKYAAKRAELMAVIQNGSASDEECKALLAGFRFPFKN